MSNEILLKEIVKEPEPQVVLSKAMASQKFNEAISLLDKHRPPNPSFTRWFRNKRFLVDIKTYPLINTWNGDYGLDNHAYPVRWVKAGAIGFVSAGLVASTIWSTDAGLSLMSLLPFAVGATISTIFDSKLYDGSMRNPVRALVCKLFLNKKSKQKVKQYRENVLAYQRFEEPFKLLVESVRSELFRSGVFDLIDSDSKGYYWCFDDLGKKLLISAREYNDMRFAYMNNDKQYEETIQQLINRSGKFQEISKA